LAEKDGFIGTDLAATTYIQHTILMHGKQVKSNSFKPNASKMNNLKKKKLNINQITQEISDMFW